MHRAISWLQPLGSRGDHGMNQRLRPLTCCLALASALALLTSLSSDALALARHKQVHHGKKADAGHNRHAALKKGRHAAHDAAELRHSAHSTETSTAPAS